jgi:hypothetical protein
MHYHARGYISRTPTVDPQCGCGATRCRRLSQVLQPHTPLVVVYSIKRSNRAMRFAWREPCVPVSDHLWALARLRSESRMLHVCTHHQAFRHFLSLAPFDQGCS